MSERGGWGLQAVVPAVFPALSLLAVAVSLLAAAAPARAAELDEVLRRGELVWAADQEGGGPHVFADP